MPYLVPYSEHREKGISNWLKEILHQFKISQCERNKERERVGREGEEVGKKIELHTVK